MMKTIRWLSAALMTVALVACSGGGKDASQAKINKQKAAFSNKVAKLEDPKLQELFSEFGFGYFMMQSMMTNMDNRPEGPPKYTDGPFTPLTDYPSAKVALDNYLGGLFLVNDPRYFRESVDVQVPFEYPYGLGIEWKQVTLDTGETLAFTDEFRAPPPAFYAVNGGSRLKVSFLEDESGEALTPLPIRAEGTLTANVPVAVHRLEFGKRDKGKAREAGAYKIKLKSIDYHIVTLEITRKDGAPADLDTDTLIIGAKDKTGQYLDDSGSGTGSPEDIAMFYKVIDAALDEALAGNMNADTAEAELEAIADSFMNDAPQTLTYQYFLRGKVENIEIAFLEPGEQVERALDIEMTNFDAPDEIDAPIRAIPVSAVVYDSATETLLTRAQSGEPTELTQAQVATDIRIDEPELRYETLHVDFDYPDMPSTIFLNDFDRYEDWDADDYGIQFYDAAGAVINVPSEKDDGPYEFTVNRFEIEVDDFPTPPVRADGFLTVNIIPNITLETSMSDALPDGIRIEDNMLIYDGKFRRDDVRIYALDANGRTLKRFAGIMYTRSESPSETAYYYYGKPAGVVIMRQGQEEKVRYEFETSLVVETAE